MASAEVGKLNQILCPFGYSSGHDEPILLAWNPLLISINYVPILPEMTLFWPNNKSVIDQAWGQKHQKVFGQ